MSGAAGPGANLTALRSHNAALVLRLLRDAGEDGVSRPELAGRTGLTPQAVSKITARLRAEGLLAEAGQRASTGGHLAWWGGEGSAPDGGAGLPYEGA
ncbi:MarR family transcriptional regulator, partial [Streptomyces asiaticus]